MPNQQLNPSLIKLIILPQALHDLKQAYANNEKTRVLEGRYLPEENIVQVFHALTTPSKQAHVLGQWINTNDSSSKHPSLLIIGDLQARNIYWQDTKLPSSNIIFYDLQHLFDRVTPILDIKTLQHKKVLVIGLGSVGSRVALELGRSGLGFLTLVDHDIIEPENIVRHITDLTDLGRYKVHAVKERILAVSPTTHIHTITRPIYDENLDELVSLIKEHDLVIIALGPHEANTKLDQALHEARVPGVFAGVFRKGIGGTIIWVHPFETACYSCVYNTLVRKGVLQQAFQGVQHQFSLRDLSETRQDYGTGTLLLAEPALNIDISIIALIQAKVALYLLLDSPHLDYIGQAIVVILGTERDLSSNQGKRKIISTGHLDKIPANYCQHYDSTDDFSIEDL